MILDLYPQLRVYVDHGFPRHVVQAVGRCLMESGGHFHPRPVFTTIDGSVWGFEVNARRIIKVHEQELAFDAFGVGATLYRDYISGGEINRE